MIVHFLHCSKRKHRVDNTNKPKNILSYITCRLGEKMNDAASRIGNIGRMVLNVGCVLSKRAVPLSICHKSLRFGLLYCLSMPSPHLPDIHLLHLCQRGGLEANPRPGRGPEPAVRRRQVNTGRRLHVARTRQGKAGHGAKC